MYRKVISLLFFALFTGASIQGEEVRVEKGDTPTALASRLKVPLGVLQKANPGLDWTRLIAGKLVVVPERHQVKAGETLYGLSRLWGTDQATLLSFNSLPSNTVLKVGQVLFLPLPNSPSGKAPKVPPASPSTFWPVDREPKPSGDKRKSVSFATVGEPFRAVSGGTVVYLGEFRGIGQVLFVQAADKTVFAYGNFESPTVEFGQAIVPGQVLGTTAARPTQKLSFFVLRDNQPLDPFTAKR